MTIDLHVPKTSLLNFWSTLTNPVKDTRPLTEACVLFVHVCLTKHLKTFCRDRSKHSNFSYNVPVTQAVEWQEHFCWCWIFMQFFILDFQYAFQFFNMSCVCTTVVCINVSCLSHEKVQINTLQPHDCMYHWIKCNNIYQTHFIITLLNNYNSLVINKYYIYIIYTVYEVFSIILIYLF